MTQIGRLVTLYIIVFLTIAISCSDDKKQCKTANSIDKSSNPNGSSELALLMRAMYDDAERVKEQVKNGKDVSLSVDHEKILTAHATEPDKAASPEYKVFAEQYLYNIKKLQSAKPSEVDNLYNTMVQNCISCHRSLCPGPIVRINKLL